MIFWYCCSSSANCVSRGILASRNRRGDSQRAIEDEIPVAGQLRAVGESRYRLADLVLDRLELRLDLANECQIGRLSLGVVGLAGHRDVTLDPLLPDRRVQLAGRDHPGFEILGRLDGAAPSAGDTRARSAPRSSARCLPAATGGDTLGDVASQCRSPYRVAGGGWRVMGQSGVEIVPVFGFTRHPPPITRHH